MDDSEKATISDSEGSDLDRQSEVQSAQISDEPEDRNKSPRGGASYEDDVVAVDPEKAVSANRFMIEITLSMFVVVLLLVLSAISGSTILLLLALVAIFPGLGLMLRNVFTMMSTD